MALVILFVVLSEVTARSSSSCPKLRGCTTLPEVGNFQIYQLAQSWTPEWCSTNQNAEECQNLGGTWAATHLALHGLWPGYDDANAEGKCQWPQCCKCQGESCEVTDADIPDNLAQYGPGYTSNNDKLAIHEWSKHGVCSGFQTPSAYFTAAIDTMLNIPLTGESEGGTPSLITSNIGGPISLADLTAAYPNKAAFQCTNANACVLIQVMTCWSVANPGSPDVGSIIDCPDWTLQSSNNNCARLCPDQINILASN